MRLRPSAAPPRLRTITGILTNKAGSQAVNIRQPNGELVSIKTFSKVVTHYLSQTELGDTIELFGVHSDDVFVALGIPCAPKPAAARWRIFSGTINRFFTAMCVKKTTQIK
jgi:hypothetical protein